MNKTLSSIALAAMVSLGLTGCFGPEKKDWDKCTIEGGTEAPPWVCMPQIAGGIASVGIAQKSPAGPGFQRQEAMANGRDALARQIAVKVKSMFKNFTQQTGVGSDAVVDKLSANVSKQIANQMLSGSKQSKYWVDRKTGDMYLLVTLDPNAAVEATKKTVKSSLRNEKALWQQFQAKKANAELDAEIEKEMGQASKL
jgi:hypothetical protein